MSPTLSEWAGLNLNETRAGVETTRLALETIKDDRDARGPSPRWPPTNAAARRDPQAVNDDINVLALVKGRERYIFLYEDSQRAEALRTLGRFASNPELSFTWYDAAVLSQKVRHAAPKTLDVSDLPRRMNLPQAE